MTIAEESTAWAESQRPTYAGGLGFTFKWNMGWMHDMLEYFGHEPVHRFFTRIRLRLGSSMPSMKTSSGALHDEVVHGKRALLDKMPGRRVATLWPTSVPSMVSCMGIPARKCCSWAESSGSGVSGTTTPAWNGISAISSHTWGSSGSYET